MEPISRRSALVLGGVGAAGVLVGAAGLISGWPSTFEPAAGGEFFEPEALRSAGGVLHTRLTAAALPVRIAGRSATALSYNGGIPGPTLFVRQGDSLRVSLENQLNAVTNLHVHGLHVSPEGTSDNVFLAIEPDATFDYKYELPQNHPPGVYWYHPHHHGNVAEQVFGGLYGAIIVEDVDPIPVARERVLVISDIDVDASGQIPRIFPMDRMLGREGALVLVNGQLAPRVTAEDSVRERWRVVNACTSRYLKLRLDGQLMHLLGIDSGRFAVPQEVTEVFLTPGNRADLLITMVAGRSILSTLPVNRGDAGMMGASTRASNVTLLSLDVTDTSTTGSSLAIPEQAPQRDLRDETVTGHRELTFAMGMGMGGGMMSFTIDGKPFDHTRVDTVVEAGAIEEWTLTNISTMDHPIHLHVWPMQIIDPTRNGPPEWQDVVNVPALSSVTVRIPFEGFTGTTVYHCHILDHEDLGMMGIITVK
ncbi:MAG: multicopper oxidase family protein [Terrimesophilobacter sp.]